MKLYLNCTANLGDFMNAMPVLSGLEKSYGKIDLVIRHEMQKFNGIKEFLLYQDIFSDVSFDKEVFLYGDVTTISSWTREDQNAPNRPIETCRYENWMIDRGFNFEVDDNFKLRIADVPTITAKGVKWIVGDRWSEFDIDARRNTHVIQNGAPGLDSTKTHYLDYSRSLMYNCNLIKFSDEPFITTFTGIGIIADLMDKETIVCWDDNMLDFTTSVWDKPTSYDFARHYYSNRKSKLVYVKDLEKLL